MSYYEHVFIARPEVAPQQVENIVEDIKKIISEDGGDTVYTEYWGLKKLAYKINKSEKGHYSLLRIDSKSSTINEIERVQKLNEDLLEEVEIDSWKDGKRQRVKVLSLVQPLDLNKARAAEREMFTTLAQKYGKPLRRDFKPSEPKRWS